MTPAQSFEKFLPFWRASLPPSIPPAYFDDFVVRMRPTLESIVGSWFERRRARRQAAEVAQVELPPDAATKSSRTRKNLEAMRIVATRRPQDMSADERRIVLGYSGWGGLSIEAMMDQFPPGMVPSDFALIHEYYTPTSIAEAIADLLCPQIAELAGHDGIVRAFEPSVGIGRLVRAMGPPRCLVTDPRYKETRWTAVELSDVSARMFAAMRPDVETFSMSLERWMSEHASRYQGTLSLVVANPPYGDRGSFALQDKHPDYQETTAYAYTMRRCLDLLVPGGLGVFIVPSGFVTNPQLSKLRERVLRRHHLEVAFRLPSLTPTGKHVVPGAHNVVDVLVWRARGGELREVDPTDNFIREGAYYKENPGHILGVEHDKHEPGLEKKRRRYAVIGEFTGFPAFTARPVCESCAITNLRTLEVAPVRSITRDMDDGPGDAGDDLRQALDLGRRVDRYLALVAAEDPRAIGLWAELTEALRSLQHAPALRAHDGNPWRWPELRALAERRALAARLLGAYQKSGELALGLATAPNIQPKFRAQPGDVVAQAEHLYRSRRHLTLAELAAFHKAQGGLLDREEVLRLLFAAEWNLDGDDWDELHPSRAYLGGMLWPKYDRAAVRADTDPQAAAQMRRLEAVMNLAVFEDIRDISPRQGWIPPQTVSAWLSETLNSRYGEVELMREGGTIQPTGSVYEKLGDSMAIGAETLWCLGWMNHDFTFFKPDLSDAEIQKLTEEDEAATGQSMAPTDGEKGEPEEGEEEEEDADLGQIRLLLGRHWDRKFAAWVRAREERQAEVRVAYNRSFRGIVIPTYDGGVLDIARWTETGPQLKPHQVAGVLRILDLGRGLIAFDVGVGKTYTAIGVIAAARQEGRIRRPVVLVPSSLVWKWHDDFLCVLQDYRVLVIGSNRKQISRGKRKGFITSESDTPEERAEKWSAFQAGLYDVVILSYDALGRTQMNKEALLTYVNTIEGLQRQIKLRQRNAAKKSIDKLSERERAILKHGARAFVEEMLELPKGHKFDPGIAWDDIGIDMLVVDEAAAFKNSYKPESREHGLPKFMGSSGDGSKRAWQLDFRAAAVRQRTGGAGIVLLTATPAKNSPLEFYNLIQLIDPFAFSTKGLMDPEQFIDRFLRIESREIIDMTLKQSLRSVVDGFKNLDDFGTILKTYGEFRTAEEVHLTLPEPRTEQVRVPLGPDQEDKYGELVRTLERALKMSAIQGSSQNKILGLLARLSMVALHARLDGGMEYNQALSVPPGDWAAPKLTACAERVAASPGCGHIIFCEPTAVHLWMREVLVAHKIPRERIAILNAIETQSADRLRIARDFNGIVSTPPAPGACANSSSQRVPPKYDVIIANSVAYEGIDLQTRTCAIHHLDLPWTPADLEQRNGRAVRQGNELPVVRIFYYLSDRSMDWYRYTLIQGKRGWLGAVLASQARDTSNPGAQQALSDEEILMMISRDPDATQRAIDARREGLRAEARHKVAREAANLLIQASARFRDARESTDTERAARLRAEGDERLTDLRRIDKMAWPWARWAERAREVEVMVPSAASAPVFEGLRVGRAKAEQVRYYELGRIVQSDGERRIGRRAHGFPVWELLAEQALRTFDLQPSELEAGANWPDEDEAELALVLESHIDHVLGKDVASYVDLVWLGASDAWLTRWWPRVEKQVRTGLARSTAERTYPLVVGGVLTLASGKALTAGELLAPNLAGWQRFLELAPASTLKFGELREAGLEWWNRKFPRGLLATQDATEEEPTRAQVKAADSEDLEDRPEEKTRSRARPAKPPAPAPAPAPASAYDDARQALSELALPAKKAAYYMQRAEESIEEGKAWSPIVARARRAAEKLAGVQQPRKKGPVPTPSVSSPAGPPAQDTAIDSFNSEPTWRAEKLRRRADAFLIVVYPEGKDVDAAVASVDIIHGEIDDLRWLDPRLSHNDRDTIRERLERALWDADADADADDNPGRRSPLQDLIDLMERRSVVLGASVAKTADLTRDDGYRHIAEALRDLAKPTGSDVDELQRWLEVEGLMTAGEMVGRARSADTASSRLVLSDIWSGVFDVLSLEQISGRPGTLVVPEEAIFRDNASAFVLQRVREGDRYVLRRIRVRVGEHDPLTGTTTIEDRTDQLTRDANLHRSDRTVRFYDDLYSKLGAFLDDLERAPKALEDVRTLLYWSAVMLDAPLCQGEVKGRAAVAFKQAKAYHDTARRQLLAGQTVDAARRIHEALRRISTGAAELARSCGDGQITLPGAAPVFGVMPSDEALFIDETTPARGRSY